MRKQACDGSSQKGVVKQMKLQTFVHHYTDEVCPRMMAIATA